MLHYLSKLVKSKKNSGHYRFTLTGNDLLEGALELQKYWAMQDKEVNEIDKAFIHLAVNLVSVFHENSLKIRVLHIVS